MPITVRVGFSTSNHFVSRIIRWATKSKVSHTWLLISNSFLGVDMVMHATMGGFQMLSYDAFKKKHKVVAILDLETPVDEGVKKAIPLLGFGYDYTGLFGAGFVILGRWLKLKWKNPFEDSSKLFCSEIVTFVLRTGGLPGAENLYAAGSNPETLLELLSANKAVSVRKVSG